MVKVEIMRKFEDINVFLIFFINFEFIFIYVMFFYKLVYFYGYFFMVIFCEEFIIYSNFEYNGNFGC